MTNEDRLHCRVLMRDGVPLVEQLPQPRFPQENTAAEKKVLGMLTWNGSLGGDYRAISDDWAANQRRLGRLNSKRGLFTRYKKG